MWDNVTVLVEHTSGTPLYTPSRWHTPGKFWYTLGWTTHQVDKHCLRPLGHAITNSRTYSRFTRKHFHESLYLLCQPVDEKFSHKLALGTRCRTVKPSSMRTSCIQ